VSKISIDRMGEIMKTLLTELKYLDAGGDEAPTPCA
jgi:hypothetical protein